VPDPQDPATFARSKLTGRGSRSLRALYGELLRARRELPRGVDSIEFSEDDRWLRVRRGRFELAMNFAARPREVPVEGRRLRLATHRAQLQAGAVRLPARAGALVA
jgi:maltooligosyltrehalose trehalohydrolase